MRVLPALVLTCLAFAACGADAVKPAPATPRPAEAKPAEKTPPKPYLGVKLDEAIFDANNGLPVEQVVPGSTAADLDVRKGDRLLTMNGKKLTSKDDLATMLGAAKVGDAIELTVARAGKDQPLTLTGKLTEKLRTVSIWDGIQQARGDLKDLKALAAAKNAKQLSLPEILDRLKEIEIALPGALEEFKKLYPNGQFAFSLHIDITSDKDAKTPATVSNRVEGKAEGK